MSGRASSRDMGMREPPWTANPAGLLMIISSPSSYSNSLRRSAASLLSRADAARLGGWTAAFGPDGVWPPALKENDVSFAQLSLPHVALCEHSLPRHGMAFPCCNWCEADHHAMAAKALFKAQGLLQFERYKGLTANQLLVCVMQDCPDHRVKDSLQCCT